MERVIFSKINGSICNVSLEAGNVFNIFPGSAVYNGLIMVKLKRDLKYQGLLYF